MNMFIYKRFIFLLISVLLISCGGGGGSVDAGIGGTGKSSRGTIDGFGSIFVNGVEYETDTASVILDSNAADEDDLRLGMIVTVKGTIDTNGTTGIANEVEFDDDIQGPIASIAINADGTDKTLVVLGNSILVNQTSTVFDDVTFATLAINDVIEVSGFLNTNSTIIATRVEKKEDFTPNVSEIEIKGTVSNLSGTQFTLNTFTVDFAGADLSDIPGGIVSNGLQVEVKGTLSGSMITASGIEEEDDLFGDDEGDVSIEGLITNFISISDFQIFGQRVDASGAELEPNNLILMDNIQVEVEGPIVNGILQAEEVEARSGEVKLKATVQSIDTINNITTITLNYSTGMVSFIVDSQTEIGDETDTFDPFSLTDINAGNFLEVKGLFNGTEIVATELRLKNPEDELIRGPVDSFVMNSSITIFGVTFLTAGASFEDSNDLPVDSATFYSQLNIDAIVKIQDDEIADGIADEVEFED